MKDVVYFYLARHGETCWNKVKRLQGRLDSPLTEMGKQQSHQLGKELHSCDIDAIYSSNLGRAFKTATIINQYLNLTINVTDRLAERDFGDWQGCNFNDLENEPFFKDVFYHVDNSCPPNGESGLDTSYRLHLFLQNIAFQTNHKRNLIVCHGDLIRCFLSNLNNVSFCDAYSQYGNGSVFRVSYNKKSDIFEHSIIL